MAGSTTLGRSLKILFLCTAHNSLSQRLYLVLKERGHHVTIELAISPELMIEAASMAMPDLIICPFLTKKVPAEVYQNYLTWIIHPGPPGDAGPSAIDWVLLGDDGSEPDAQKALERISTNKYVASGQGRSHWGVTILEAIEEFDAGPVWAWDQFPLVLDGPKSCTKASLYRGPVTKAAVTACLTAIDRLLSTSAASFDSIRPGLPTHPLWQIKSVTHQQSFLGGKTQPRPLLKPTQRAWNPQTDSATLISRRLRASDSQPGVQSNLLYGTNLYLYGGLIEENSIRNKNCQPGEVIAQRDSAVLVSTADGKGVWITHVRRLKPKNQALLPAKLPAMLGLQSIPGLSQQVDFDAIPTWALAGFTKVPGTLQEVWIEYDDIYGAFKTAYIFSNFYNGAASTSQCQQLLAAIEEVVSRSDVAALILMGGDYWNNGIHLGVCSTNVAQESWKNINAINDCVEALLKAKSIVTFAAIRGNAAAGGFALATCCDFVFCAENAVINPHYRAVGLYGSEYHTLTWYARAGEENAKALTSGILPLSARKACELGLVDVVIDSGERLTEDIKSIVMRILLTDCDVPCPGAPWTKRPYSRNNSSEHRRMIDSVPLRKHVWLASLPQALSSYREQELDFMKLNFTDPRYEQCVLNFTGKAAPTSTPLRFALHRRHSKWEKTCLDPEEESAYFHYPNIDAEAVHTALGIPHSQPIHLIPPPSCRHALDLWLQKNLTLKDTEVSPSLSESSTLNGSLQMSRKNSPPPNDIMIQITDSHDGTSNAFLPPDYHEDTASLPLEYNDFDSQAPRRLFRVVRKIKSAFLVKQDQSDHRIDEKSLHRNAVKIPAICLSASSTGSDHQMSCYYSAIDTKPSI